MNQLRKYLKRIPEGEITDTAKLEELLTKCWDEFVGDHGGMAPQKLLRRMEDVLWRPPVLRFVIERHGGTVMGSSRAELQYWTVDVEHKTATMGVKGYRQISPSQSTVDVKPIANKLTELIINGHNDERLQWSTDGRVRILSGKIFPDNSVKKQTLEGRKKRLIKAMEERLTQLGWLRKGSWWVRKV